MDINQKASAYAIAKILGCEKTIEEFITEYSQYYDEAYKKLQSEQPKNIVYATQHPFRN